MYTNGVDKKRGTGKKPGRIWGDVWSVCASGEFWGNPSNGSADKLRNHSTSEVGVCSRAHLVPLEHRKSIENVSRWMPWLGFLLRFHSWGQSWIIEMILIEIRRVIVPFVAANIFFGCYKVDWVQWNCWLEAMVFYSTVTDASDRDSFSLNEYSLRSDMVVSNWTGEYFTLLSTWSFFNP